MKPFPFHIPQSLKTYVEQFENSPEKVIQKLEKHVKKRGYDAVGHFLLSWFYHQKGESRKAISHAFVAKNYAPGSSLMEHLHFYLMHPNAFEAVVPSGRYASNATFSTVSGNAPVLDLDKLIELLTEAENHRIRIKANDDSPIEDLGAQSTEVDDIATETLANIHTAQGSHEEAIRILKLLIQKKPEEKTRLNKKITEIKKKAKPSQKD